MTFREYLMARRVTDTPMGDFVADAKADRTFPDGDVTWVQVELHLRGRRASEAAIKAGKAVWGMYLQRRHLQATGAK